METSCDEVANKVGTFGSPDPGIPNPSCNVVSVFQFVCKYKSSSKFKTIESKLFDNRCCHNKQTSFYAACLCNNHAIECSSKTGTCYCDVEGIVGKNCDM